MGQFLTKQKVKDLIDTAPPDIPKDQIVQELVNRGHEIEGLNASFSFGEMGKNIPGSVLEFGKNIWAAVKNPKQTVNALSSTAKGGIRAAIEATGLSPDVAGAVPGGLGQLVGTPDDKQVFDSLVDFMGERYGGKDRLLNTIEKDPAGFMSDLSTVLGGAGGALKAMGTAGKVGKMADVGGKVAKFSSNLDPLTAITKTTRQAAKVPAKAAFKFNEMTGMNKWLSGKAGEFAEKALAVTPAQANKIANKTFKKPPGQVLAELGIHGTLDEISVQLESLARTSKGQVDKALASVKQTYKNENVSKTLNSLYKKIGEPKSEELIAVKNRIEELLEKHDGKPAQTTKSGILDAKGNPLKKIVDGVEGEGLTLTEMNEVKRILDHIDSPYQKTGEIAGIGVVDFGKSNLEAMDVKNLRNYLQKTIEKEAAAHGITNIKELNKNTMFGTEVNKLVNDAKFSLKDRKSVLDSLILQAGLAGSIFTARAEFLIGATGVTLGKRVIQSPQFRTAVANRLMLMSKKDFSAFQKAVKSGKPNAQATGALRKVFGELRQHFPEIRMAGIIKENNTGRSQK